MSIASNFPAIKPTLLLDFANTEALDPRITFTRASTATYYGTQTAKAEENLLAFSQDFNETTWGKTDASVSANTVAAPDGTTTADTLTFTSAGGNQRVTATSPTLGSQNYVFSVFLKGTAGQTVTIEFDATASAVTLTASWARYTVSGSATTTSSVVRIISRTGNTATVFDIWGAQLEQRSAVSAYTATTTQAITNYIPVLKTAASGVARFDHNPTTFESLGLEIEESRTNLVLRSEEFDNAAWAKTASSITANTIVAPDGTLTGDKLVEDTSTGGHLVLQSVTLADSTTCTVTVFVKAAERIWVAVGLTDKANTNNRVWFNASTGAQGTTNGTVSAASATSVGNGWWRFSASVSSATGATTPSVRISLGSADDTAAYTGDGYSGLFIWGAQLEAGAFATSYIPTVASQVTRAADAASMTGTNFSSWYNAAEGSLYADALRVNIPVSANTTLADISDGTTNNRIRFWVWSGATSTLRFTVVNGTNQADLSLGTLSSGVAFKAAGAYRVNDFAGSLNAGTVLTDTSGSVPSGLSRFDIGAAGTTGEAFNGTIRKIAYYPIRVSNTNLQALTS